MPNSFDLIYIASLESGFPTAAANMKRVQCLQISKGLISIRNVRKRKSTREMVDTPMATISIISHSAKTEDPTFDLIQISRPIIIYPVPAYFHGFPTIVKVWFCGGKLFPLAMATCRCDNEPSAVCFESNSRTTDGRVSGGAPQTSPRSWRRERHGAFIFPLRGGQSGPVLSLYEQ